MLHTTNHLVADFPRVHAVSFRDEFMLLRLFHSCDAKIMEKHNILSLYVFFLIIPQTMHIKTTDLANSEHFIAESCRIFFVKYN